jgi:N-acetylglucosamine-6-phosphate deacetylase
MIIKNIKIVTNDDVIDNGYIAIDGDLIQKIGVGDYTGNDANVIDGEGKIAMPGFIDVHLHGSIGIDFMDAEVEDYKNISASLYEEGVTTYLATTLTADKESLAKVCKNVALAKKDNPSLYGIHFEGPYICVKFKGAQNENFIRLPDINEFDELNKIAEGNVKYISMAPEKEGAMEFIKHLSSQGVTVSAGHTEASFDDVAEAIKNGLTNTTHTHNAMSGHHHRNPGVVTAAMYFDELYCEVICDGIHVCENTLKTFYKTVGPDRFVMVTDALKAKHSDLKEFQLFGLDCERRDGAAYLLSGPLAGSLLTMDQGLRNVKKFAGANLVELAKISSKNAAKSLHLTDRGELKEGLLADIVLLDNDLKIKDVYKLGKKVF